MTRRTKRHVGGAGGVESRSGRRQPVPGQRAAALKPSGSNGFEIKQHQQSETSNGKRKSAVPRMLQKTLEDIQQQQSDDEETPSISSSSSSTEGEIFSIPPRKRQYVPPNPAIQQRGPPPLSRLLVEEEGTSRQSAFSLLLQTRASPVVPHFHRLGSKEIDGVHYADRDLRRDDAKNADDNSSYSISKPDNEDTTDHATKLSKVSSSFMHDKCVKEHVFPMQKFATLNGDLDFSNNPSSICRFMASKLQIEDHNLERWWETAKLSVHECLKRHRNNVIKSIKKVFIGMFVSGVMSNLILRNLSNNHSSSPTRTEKLLPKSNGHFNTSDFSGMLRSEATREAYTELLDSLLKSVVGYKRYMANRVTQPLSEWFTKTDEAFLLLCMEAYSGKWRNDWTLQQRQLHGRQTAAIEDNDNTVSCDALYTGKTRGTKRSWSESGLERFNMLMINVYRDRRAYGESFDEEFLEEMKQRYLKVAQKGDPLAAEEQDSAPQQIRQKIVYNEFNLELLMAHVNNEKEQAQGDPVVDNDDEDEQHVFVQI